MGQFLALGLAYEIIAPLDPLRKYDISIESLRQEIQQSLYYDMDLYETEEIEKSLVFTIKDNVFNEGLIPFLETVYPHLYDNPDGRDGYAAVLDRLRSTPCGEWIDFAQDKENFAFQMDDYIEPRYIEMPIDFRPEVRLRFGTLIFYVGYGKIITEGMHDFMDFFKFCFQEAFKDHPIAKAVQVNITG